MTNNGPEDVTASVVTDNFDPAVYDVVNVSWTCATGAGSGPGTSCPPSGIGADLVAGVDVNVESGDTVSFSVDAPVLQAAAGLLSNTATVDPPAGVTDPALGNNSATDIDGVPGACGFANDLDLSNQAIDTVETFTVCNSIAAGAQFEVGSPGDLTFRADVVVVLRNGFSVQSGARFSAVLDASLASP